MTILNNKFTNSMSKYWQYITKILAIDSSVNYLSLLLISCIIKVLRVYPGDITIIYIVGFFPSIMFLSGLLDLRQRYVPVIMSMTTYVKYCNFIKRKHINLDIFNMYNDNDVNEFNRIKFHDRLEQLTINTKRMDYDDTPDLTKNIIFPNTIKELNILSRLNHFENYIFNENIKTIRYVNMADSFEKYDATNNLHVQNYIGLLNTDVKIEKVPYGCTSNCCDYFHMNVSNQYIRYIKRYIHWIMNE